MIPEEKSAAVERALREAFGVTAFDDVCQLTKGNASSLVFRIVVKGSPYVLKMILRNDDATRHFACMRSAAEAGLAPRVRYTSVEDRVAITDFVVETPFPRAEALVRIPQTLRAVHALPPFAGVPDHLNTTCTFLLNDGAAVEGFLRNFREAGLVPESEKEEVLARYAQLKEAYRRNDADLVSSHNDLFKPDNMLFDGRRLWLVDWEAAFLNDRYADLAAVANLVVTSDADESVFLLEYFGEEPSAYQRARFFLMRQLAHIFYGTAFLLMGSGWRPSAWGSDTGEPAKPSEEAPDFADFHRRFWAGEVDLKDKQTKGIYGRVHWERVVSNSRQARFDEALRIVAAGG